LLRGIVRRAIAASNPGRAALGLAGAATAAVLAVWIAFPARYLDPREGGLPFTLIQPDLRQEVIGDPRYYEANFHKMASLTRPLVPRTRRIVFWPESGLPDYLRDGYPRSFYRQMNFGADPAQARERIGRVIGPYSLLLTGAVDLVMKDGDDIAARNTV